MKKILSQASIKNEALKWRKDLSPLIKTYLHRFHYQSEETFKKWLKILSIEELYEIKKRNGPHETFVNALINDILPKKSFYIKFVTRQGFAYHTQIKALNMIEAIEKFHQKYPSYHLKIILDETDINEVLKELKNNK